MTGRTLGQPRKASAVVISIDCEQTVAFQFPNPGGAERDLPSVTNPVAEPLGDVEHFACKVEPDFVRSTASAEENPTNVAVRGMIATEGLGIYGLSCHPGSNSTISSASESFDFGCSGQDSERPVAGSAQVSDSVNYPRSPREASRVSPDPSDLLEALTSEPPRHLKIKKTMRMISATEVEVIFRITYRPPENAADEEVPVLPSHWHQPHLLSPISEEDEDEDDTGSVTSEETVCTTGIPECARDWC